MVVFLLCRVAATAYFSQGCQGTFGGWLACETESAVTAVVGGADDDVIHGKRMDLPSPNSKKPTAGDPETFSLNDLARTRASEGVLVLDARGQPLNFTPDVPRLLGWPETEAASEQPRILPPPLESILQRCLREGAPLPHQEVVLPRANGEPAKLEFSAMPIATGTTVVLVVLLRDRCMTEKLLRWIDQMDRLASVGTMSAGVCHEIKNALVPVKTLLDVILKQSPDPEMADLVGRELRRIDSLVSQMLRFAGPTRPASALFRLHEVLAHTLKLVEHQAAASGVSVSWEFSASSDAVRGDHYQVQQALQNLLFNAIEAMPAGGQLSVATQSKHAAGPRTPATITVLVRDTGCGIAEENLARLFEPFFTTKPRGNGLGLAITQRIVREHAGEIAVESKPGHGTTFIITLPAAEGSH